MGSTPGDTFDPQPSIGLDDLDPCRPAGLAKHPPLDGRSAARTTSGVRGVHCKGGVAVSGLSFDGTAVFAQSLGSGQAMFASSESAEALHAETDAPNVSAIVGLMGRPRLEAGRVPAAIWGASRSAEGVHGETRSTKFSALVGIQLNESSPTAAIWGEHKGGGLAAFLKGDLVCTGEIDCRQADCAEQFDIAPGSVAEPGTVMVVDDIGALLPCMESYDRKVAGIVSGAGPFRPAIVLDKHRRDEPGRVPLALVGKVYCKVDAGFAPIAVGDLLTTSCTPGHAMRAGDAARAFGAVIGKALGPLAAGTGLIPVLVALQ